MGVSQLCFSMALVLTGRHRLFVFSSRWIPVKLDPLALIPRRTSAFIQTAKMLSRFYLPKPLILLLWTIVYCASCTPLQKLCAKCTLSCDGALELKEHQMVHVVVEHQSVVVLDETPTVSSLLQGGRCSVVVPDCSKWGTDTPFTLRMYAVDKESVSEPFYDKTPVMPDCASMDPMDPLKIRNDADRNLSNKLLILLPVCLCIYFYIKRPRCVAHRHSSYSI